jgi:hypothetical protein
VKFNKEEDCDGDDDDDDKAVADKVTTILFKSFISKYEC